MSLFKPPKRNPFQLGRTPLPSTAWKLPPPAIDLSQRIPDPKSLTSTVPVFTRRNTLVGSLTFVGGDTKDFFLPGCSCSALWIEFQLGQSAQVQLLKNNVPISKLEKLSGGAFRRYAGLLLTGNEKLSLFCSTAQTITFEVAWTKDHHQLLLLVDDMVSGGSSGGGGSVTWDAIGNAVGNLTLNNANFTTTFQQSSAVKWTWQNTIAATASVTQFSPVIALVGEQWNGSASVPDEWDIQVVPFIGQSSELQITSQGSLATNLNANILFQAPNGNLNSVIFTNSVLATVSNVTQSPLLTFNCQFWNGVASGNNQWVIVSKCGAGSNAPSLLYLDFEVGTSGITGVTTNSGMFQFHQVTTNFLDFGAGSTGWTLNFTNSTQATQNGFLSFTTAGVGSLQLSSSGNNPRLQLSGFVTTQNASAVRIDNGTNTFTGTLNQNVVNIAGSFAPTSGAGQFRGNLMQLTVNQTGTATGTYQAFMIQVIETALLGSPNYFMMCQGGTAGTTSRFAIDNSGMLVLPNTANMGIGTGANTNMQAPALGAGSGPASLIAASWEKISANGLTYWIPLFQ